MELAREEPDAWSAETAAAEQRLADPALRLAPGLGCVWQAFFTLCSERPRVCVMQMVGQTPAMLLRDQPIPFRAIDAFAQRYAIVGRAFDEFATFIGALDGEYLKIMNDRATGGASETEQDT